MINFVGRFNLWFSVCILFLNNLCSGLISLRFIFFGRLFILWCDLMVIDGLFEKLIDLIILGYSVFWVRNLVFLMVLVYFWNMLMNSLLMVLCLVLGLEIFLSLLRNRLDLLVWIRLRL